MFWFCSGGGFFQVLIPLRSIHWTLRMDRSGYTCTIYQKSSTSIGWRMNAVPAIYLPLRLPSTKFFWRVPSGRWILMKQTFSSCLCTSRVSLARRRAFRGLDMHQSFCKQQWSMCPRRCHFGIAIVEEITFSLLLMITVPVFIPWWESISFKFLIHKHTYS